MKEECARTLRRAYLFLDREVLSERERVAIQAHLEACRPCYECYGLVEEMSALVARLRNCQRCPEEVRVRISSLFL
jgi:mycothiol system anti-sigma-R factor